MSETIVDRLYGEFKDLVSYIDAQKQPSLLIIADTNFRKSLLLAAASYFEHRVTEEIVSFVNETSNSNQLVAEFVRNKAISRQYHSFFEWDKPNANKFFSLFGGSFKASMQAEIKGDANFDAAIKAFIEIGRDRNRLVHQDYGNFYLEKTADEIYNQYKVALRFLEVIPAKMRQVTFDIDAAPDPE